MSKLRITGLPALSLIVLVVACGAPDSSPSPSPSPSPPAPQSPDPTASATAHLDEPSATPAPQATPSASAARGLEWQLIGQIDGQAAGLTSFDSGYLSLTYDAAIDGVWFSPDGIGWQLSQIGQTFVPCPGWAPRSDANVDRILAAGSQVVLLGAEYDPDNWQCGDDGREAWRAAAWTSTDGRQWQHALLDMPPRTSDVSAVWHTRDGWEAAVTENDDTPAPGETVILASPDGLTWRMSARLGNRIAPYDATGPLSAAAVDNAGRRVLAISDWIDDSAAVDEEATVIRLLDSSDGVTWRELEAPFAGRHLTRYEELPFVTQVIGPADAGGRWLFVVQTEGGSPATVWTTRDLATWQDAEFRRPTVDFITPTGLGLIAQGRVECYHVGSACPAPRQRQFVSPDGASWEPLEPRLTGELSVSDGPAGVLLVGHDSGRVWRLER